MDQGPITVESAKTILIDFRNILYQTDKFVLSIAYDAMKDSDILSALYQIADKVKDDMSKDELICSLVNTKTTTNPLLDIAVLSNTKYEFDLLDNITNEMYDTILYNDYNGLLVDKLEPTMLANVLQMLIKAPQFENLYVYTERNTKDINDTIYNFFMNSNKVRVVSGNLKDFIENDHLCDLYIFNDLEMTKVLYGLSDNIPKNVMMAEYQSNYHKGIIKIDPEVAISHNIILTGINVPI